MWVDTQFQTRPGKMTPGTITVVDASTMKVKRVIEGDFDNPHNLMVSWDERYVIQTNWHSNYISVLNAQDGRVLKNRIRVGESPAHTHTTPQGKVVVTINAQDRIAVLDLSKLVDPAIPAAQVPIRYIEVPLGPHGGWISPDGKIFYVADMMAVRAVSLAVEKCRALPAPRSVGEFQGRGGHYFYILAVDRGGTKCDAVLVRDDRAQLLHALRHRSREAMDRGLLAEGLLQRRRVHRSDRVGIERADSLLQLQRP